MLFIFSIAHYFTEHVPRAMIMTSRNSDSQDRAKEQANMNKELDASRARHANAIYAKAKHN